ncbi:MAG TPA: transglutaminaseTgpA domain-containing protein [Acidimicrobiales bacterium]|nr:transglutaminaseTgpA domain-containing protein [Acidimicrobiales bacterium]
MTLWTRVVEANRPGPAEHSIRFRIASALVVIIAIAACWSQGELGAPLALFAIAATVVGNAFSYWRRQRPWPLVKPILAACVVGGFVWFIVTVTRSASPGDISTVEAPLAALFAWVLSTHSFDVPARKDVAYSLAGSAALMAVAAAQTVDLSLGIYVLAWVVCGLWGLVAMWQSMSGAQGVPWITLGVAGLVVALLTVVLVSLLPAPHVSTSLVFPSSSAGAAPVNSPSNLTDGGSAGLPAHAASPSGKTGVGGFLGFAKSLNTGVRAPLGDQVVMRVRATRPAFWVGQTYDTWDGRSWMQSKNPADGPSVQTLTSGSPFDIPLASDQQASLSPGSANIQTFYLAQSGPNLVFHADNAQRVYLQSQHLLVTNDGTIVSSTSMGTGTVYTVVSADSTATAAQLQAATTPGAGGIPPATLTADQQTRYLQLAQPDPRVAALAQKITAGIGTPGDPDPHTEAKVSAIEAWMSSHIHYSTDIPPLPANQNAVDSFLFGSRIGFCEQISTATAVMLRSLGIPAREAVGYVPGSYNPITDLYQVEAKDAHAWVQVWFPGYGWQNFDPTANVPLANPSPGSVIAAGTAHFLGRLPWVPIGAALVVMGGGFELRRRRLRRPPTWAHRSALELERAGSRSGITRRTDETLVAYCGRLADAAPGCGPELTATASVIEGFAYGGIEPSAEQLAWLTAFTRHFRIGRAPTPATGSPSSDGAGQRRDTSRASSKEAAAASSGR